MKKKDKEDVQMPGAAKETKAQPFDVIIKRDGRQVPFNPDRIADAIYKAMSATGRGSRLKATRLAGNVMRALAKDFSGVPYTVEEAQDQVEKALIRAGLAETAKAYILYRAQRTRVREAEDELNKLVSAIEAQTSRENANIGTSPAAKMLQIGAAASRRYYLSNVIPAEMADAHVNGDLHIHDLDFYGKTLNCLEVPLGKLLVEGFNPGHGYIRPPKRPMSAVALASIIVQSSQNDMFGGQGYAFFDRDMAPYVDGLSDREIYQAMEALVYNANTMHSRAGSQTPFFSVNLGTEMDGAGRKITRNLLLAFEAGLGHGENPIFPNIIFRVKRGINLDPGDPNYDLFQLALKVAARRLNPTFSFMDAPFNAEYGTQVAYMGCVAEDELVIYRKGKTVYMESIRRLHERTATDFGLNREGETEYADVTGYALYDTNRGFVPLLRTLKNPDHNDWYLVRMSNGRSIEVTSDHRWAVLERGVVLTKELCVGDLVQVTWKTPGFSECARRGVPGDRGLKKAYLLGLLLCDGTWNDRQVVCSLHKDDQDLAEAYRQYMRDVFGKEVAASLLHDERRGYVHQSLYCGSISGRQGLPNLADYLARVFEGRLKPERHVPRGILNWSREARLWFLAGMVDGDGYVNTKPDSGGSRIQFHITNKEVALQVVGVAQSLGYPSRFYVNRNGTFVADFGAAEELVALLRSWRKNSFRKPACMKEPEIVSIVEIQPVATDGTKPSYCVTTVSGFMMCSFIHIGQCRTRVMANRRGPVVTDARGNLSATTVNLPRLAIKARGNLAAFGAELEQVVDMTIRQLLHRFQVQARLKVRDMPFVMGQHLYLGSEGLGPDDSIEPAMVNGTLAVGFIGLAEALVGMMGVHHGQSTEAQALGLKVVSAMRGQIDRACEEHDLNFTLLATPAEGLSGRFVGLDRKKYGVVPGITDREFYTNSFHIPVDFPISAFDKIALEGPYHKFCNAGHISYVELGSPPQHNVEAMEAIIRHMAASGMGYAGVNYPVDNCRTCGYSGVISTETCPNCGATGTITRVRRITGYLGTTDMIGSAKMAEIAARVAHNY